MLPYPSGTYCLTWAYNMYGFHISSLDVIRVRGETQHQLVWHLFGQRGEDWYNAAFNIDLQPGDKVREPD